MKNQKFANQLLADNPNENKVLVTEDQQGFFNELDAQNHAARNKFEEPEVFFREGFEPEDVQELEEGFKLAKEENGTMKNALEQIIQTLDLQKPATEVDEETHPVVAGVVILREAYQSVQADLETSKGELESTKSELETAHSDLDAVKGQLETAQSELKATKEELVQANTDLETLRGNLEVLADEERATKDNLPKVKK